MHAVLVAISIGSAVAGSVWANDDVRAVQEKLRDDGFYSGAIDGAYSSDLSAALTRYQIRNGLPITGQLDADTSKALGAKAAVVNSATGTEQSSSETWRRLRKGGQKPSANARTTSSPGADETGSSTEMPLRSAAAVKARTSSETTEPASARPATTQSSSGTTEPVSAPPAAASDTSSSAGDISTERLRDYVAAYILAGLDKNVGAESEFFADRVEYYDSGQMSRESIREDLKRYDERWPERHFWLAGTITVEPQNDNRVKVTFPLGFKLRNGNKIVNGKVDKTLVLEPAGDDLEIVAVNERKER
jgi:Putative peptidoglycan binding domain